MPLLQMNPVTAKIRATQRAAECCFRSSNSTIWYYTNPSWPKFQQIAKKRTLVYSQPRGTSWLNFKICYGTNWALGHLHCNAIQTGLGRSYIRKFEFLGTAWSRMTKKKKCKEDLNMWKETDVFEMRLMYMESDRWLVCGEW